MLEQYIGVFLLVTAAFFFALACHNFNRQNIRWMLVNIACVYLDVLTAYRDFTS